MGNFELEIHLCINVTKDVGKAITFLCKTFFDVF